MTDTPIDDRTTPPSPIVVDPARVEFLLTAVMQEVRASRYRPDDDFKLYKRHLDLELKLTVLMMFVGLNIFFTFLILILVPGR